MLLVLILALPAAALDDLALFLRQPRFSEAFTFRVPWVRSNDDLLFFIANPQKNGLELTDEEIGFTPRPLPSPKGANDLAFKRLRGPVKSLLEQRALYDAAGREGSREPGIAWTFDRQGNIIRYDQRLGPGNGRFVNYAQASFRNEYADMRMVRREIVRMQYATKAFGLHERALPLTYTMTYDGEGRLTACTDAIPVKPNARQYLMHLTRAFDTEGRVAMEDGAFRSDGVNKYAWIYAYQPDGVTCTCWVANVGGVTALHGVYRYDAEGHLVAWGWPVQDYQDGRLIYQGPEQTLTEWATYTARGDLAQCTARIIRYTQYPRYEIVPAVIAFDHYVYDDHGNWIARIACLPGEPPTPKAAYYRTIEYYQAP